MKSIIAELTNFTDKEKAEMLAIFAVILFCTCAVLLGITWSRGNDVQYFKERIVLMDQRMTVIDKKIHDTNMELIKTNEHLAETKRLAEAESHRNTDQDKWIEYWKTLPQLPQPKPQQRR
jgi:Tfp pilus assembly protein PilN